MLSFYKYAKKNWWITKEQFEEIRQKAQNQIDKLKIKIDQLDYAEKEYYLTTARLVELGSRSAEIFRRSKAEEKRALINFVLSNATIEGKKLRYKAKFPFDMVLEYAPRSAWLRAIDAIRTCIMQDNTRFYTLLDAQL